MRSLALSVGLLAAAAVAQDSITCAEGLYLIVARGTGEVQGTGITGVLADRVADQIPDSIIEPLDYPATFTDPNYPVSEQEGVKEMQEVINSYHESCPEGKIAVLGYSQGGQVASDAFCGGSGNGFSEAAALPIELVDDSVVAIILFGDPSHVANVSYDKGTSIKDGIFARDNVTLCEDNYSDILRSYCDTGDTYCDGGSVRAVHSGYVTKYGDEVVEFIVSQFKSAQSGSNDSSTSKTATSETATATPSASATEAVTEASTPTTTATGTAAPGNAAAGLGPSLAAVAVVPLLIAALELL